MPQKSTYWVICASLKQFTHADWEKQCFFDFVTRKITIAVSKIKKGLIDKLYLGNLNAKRDWGFAGDYVEAMWLILQQDKPDDYVIATGETHSVREFTELAFKEAGINLEWEGEGVNEIGRDVDSGRILVEVDPTFYRSTEVDLLIGDSSRAREKLGWKTRVSFEELVRMMVKSDLLVI
jgi:GDPmannose 4,6-dehydratase